MTNREMLLMDNDVILAGIFLDPRYKIVLDASQINRAKNHLKLLWIRLLTLKEVHYIQNDVNEQAVPDVMSNSSNSSTDEMEVFLRKKDTEHKIEVDVQNGENLNKSVILRKKIENILTTYETDQKRVRLTNTTIFDFWKK